jgi:hypothetical protein
VRNSSDKRSPSLYTDEGSELKFYFLHEGLAVSIIRIGLAETKHFSEGYEAIFGAKKKSAPAKAKKTAKKAKPAKKKAKK